MIWLRFCTILLAAAAALATVTGTASAQATQGTFYNQETLVFPETDALCTDLSGTTTNVVTDSGHFVLTDDTFHISGAHAPGLPSELFGRHISPQLLADPISRSAVTRRGKHEFTEAQQDRATLYSANGDVIGIVSVFTQTHQTWRDANGNGMPDPGEFTANVSQFRVTCA